MLSGQPAARIATGPALDRLRRRGLSPIGMGCARIGSLSSGVTAEQARATLAAAAAEGITFFDTAGIYGGGESERLVGAHAQSRPGVYVMTKIGRHHALSGQLAHWAKRWVRPLLGEGTRRMAATARQRRGVAIDFSPAALEAATRAALRRLGVDTINALLLHSPPPAVLAEPATAATLARLKEHGWADEVGVSCDDMEMLQHAAGFCTLDIVQLPIGLYRLALQSGLVDRLIARDVAIVVRGVLAEDSRISPAEALAAAAALPGIASVIVGVSSPAHVAGLAAATRP